MSDKETPKTDNSDAPETDTESSDNKETTSTEFDGSKESESGSEEESLLVASEDEKDGEKSKEEAEAEAEIKYELSLPEEALVSQETLDGIMEFAKENKLSNDAAQKMVERENEAVKTWAESQQEAFQKSRDQWMKDAKNDKEFGRENFEKTSSGVKQLLAEFADDELKEGLKNTGFDAYAPLWRFLARIDASRESDKIAAAEAAASAREIPLAHKMYPELAPKE